MSRVLCLTACLFATLVSPAAAQHPVRVFVGPLPSARGITPAESQGDADSHREIRQALRERKGVLRVAQLVDAPHDADLVISVQARQAANLTGGKKLIAVGTMLRARTETTVFDGTQAIGPSYHQQARQIAEQAERWLRAHVAAIRALRQTQPEAAIPVYQAATHDPVRVYVGPLPSARGIAATLSDDELDSYRDIRNALRERTDPGWQLVDAPDDADFVISVDRRDNKLWDGKRVMAIGTLLHARSESALFDGTKAWLQLSYRQQANEIAEQAVRWLRANAAAILALR